MIALLVLMAVMAVAMTVALPAWSTMARRERETELVWRGEQYARAIQLFQRKYAGTFPPSVDVLITEHVLRKKYKDPITNDDFQTIGVGQPVSGPQTTNPLAPGGGAAATTPGRAGSAGQPPRGGAGGSPQQTGARGGFVLPGTATGQGSTTQGGRGTTGVGGVGASAGIMGVTSKSTDASLRIYKGADHYNQWLFIGTQASTQAGGRGAQSPGQGVRGGLPPGVRPAGPGTGGRGVQSPTLPGAPFGTSPFGRGSTPSAPAPGGGR
jgi:type II secretory pathway pseudopilin PulG